MLVTVAKCFDPWEAHIVCARLCAEKIPGSVAFANHSLMDWPISFALAGSAVQVPAVHLEAARAVVSAYRSGELEKDLHAALGTEPHQCMACGSERFLVTIKWSERALVALLAVFGAPFPTRQVPIACATCGARSPEGAG